MSAVKLNKQVQKRVIADNTKNIKNDKDEISDIASLKVKLEEFTYQKKLLEERLSYCHSCTYVSCTASRFSLSSGPA